MRSAVSSNKEPNALTLQNNATYAEEQLALYDSQHSGAYTLTAGTGNTIAMLSLSSATNPDTTSSILSLAAAQDAAYLLSPSTDPTVIAGYTAQRALLLDQLASTNSPIGSTTWWTGPSISMFMIKPLSRGSIQITSTNMSVQPKIDFAALRDPTDLQLAIALFRKNREIFASEAMKELGPVELPPTAGMVSDEEIGEALKGIMTPSNGHECCTSPMMARWLGGVVDSAFRVYGVLGLSVVDASIFPFIPAGAPTSTVYAVAEKVRFSLTS